MQICLESVLKYEQPTKYIVNSPKYSDTFSIPVLTAGKSFVLGYTDEKDGLCRASQNPVIIFDDFTADCKYVDFDFKVKSSAMKILHKVNQNDNLKYYFYAMQAMDYTPFSHKRVWISEYSKLKIKDHSVAEQNKITADLDNVINAINNANKRLNALDELVKSRFIMMFGDPLQPPQSRPLGNIALLERGKFSPRPRNDPRYYNGVYPFVQTGDVANCDHRLTSYHQTLNENGIKVSKCFSSGTILIALVGATIGATAILEIDAYAPDSLIGITPKLGVCDNVFLETLLQFWQPELKRIAPETARANLNLGILEKVPIIDADFAVQQDFAAFVRDIDKSKVIVQKQIEDLKELFDSKMTVYFG